ncbi:MAG: porin, partial [Cetobacterium sp.]
SETYNSDWYQEVQLLGIRHRLPNKDSVWASIYNEYKYSEDSSEYIRWQLRIGYNWNATSKLAINPFARFDLHYNEEDIKKNSKTYKDTRDKNETRLGTTFNYKIDPTLTFVGEVYWQTAMQEAYNGSSSPDKDRMFYKLGLRKSF